MMRAGDADFRGLEFQIPIAISMGGVRTVAFIGHDSCSMAHLEVSRDTFVAALIDDSGWNPDAAVRHFDGYAPRLEVRDSAGEVREAVDKVSLLQDGRLLLTGLICPVGSSHFLVVFSIAIAKGSASAIGSSA